MKISHLMYKVDDLKQAVKKFSDLGFTVEYGKKENPYNAIIYMKDHTYIELVQNQHITKTLQFFLKLFGMKDYLESSLEQEKRKEGFMRFALHMELFEKKKLSKRYKDILGVKTFLVPVRRNDIHGNALKCKCLIPSDATLPFFNTEFEASDIWNVEHPNKVVGIKKLTYGGIQKEIKFFEELPVDTRVSLAANGTGISHLEFDYENETSEKVLFENGAWEKIRNGRE